MNKKILVPLGRYDRTEEMIPYVEKIARPGMKVIFMVPYQVDGIRWSTEESGLKAIEDGMRLAGYYAWDTNLEKAKDRISPALDVLRAKGIEVGVDLYAGNMRTALEDCAAKGDVHLIVARVGIGEWIGRLFDGTTSIFKWFKRPSFSPVLLINPRTLV